MFNRRICCLPVSVIVYTSEQLCSKTVLLIDYLNSGKTTGNSVYVKMAFCNGTGHWDGFVIAHVSRHLIAHVAVLFDLLVVKIFISPILSVE